MRIAPIVLLGLFASASFSAQQAPAVCERIQQVDSRMTNQLAHIQRLLQVFSEAHPDVISARRILASIEASRAAEVAQARSQGVSCSSSAQRDNSENPKEKINAAQDKQ